MPPSFWTLLQALLSYFDTDMFKDVCVHMNDYNVFLCLSLRFAAQHGTAGTNDTRNKSSLTALLFRKQKINNDKKTTKTLLTGSVRNTTLLRPRGEIDTL